MQNRFVALLLLCGFWGYGQNSYKIFYEKYSNGITIEEENPIAVWANEQKSIMTTKATLEGKKQYPQELIIYQKHDSILHYMTYLSQDSIISTKKNIAFRASNFKKTSKTKRILGIKAKHAEININSNKIDLWYVDNMKIEAAPNGIGLPLGFVLEYERNNNYSIRVAKIEEEKNSNSVPVLAENLEEYYLDPLDYSNLIWKSKFTSIPIFDHQKIHFDPSSTSDTKILRFANGTVAVKKISFPEITENQQIFLEVNQHSNGDAYDRTGSIFLIPTQHSPNFLEAMQKGVNTLPFYSTGDGKKYQGVVRKDQYEPIVELMRFFTPFGIQKFNHIELKDRTWLRQADYRQDISELRTLLSNQTVYIGVFIGNYDQGGHMIDAEITIHHGLKKLFPSSKVIPLFNTLNVMEMGGQEYGSMFADSKGLVVEFELKEELKNAQLRYLTSGHGGWENGDEFLPKPNHIKLDDKEIFNLIPWRTECGSYRNANPASGNFENGLSSSDYSRSNWCPGTVTNPYYIPIGNLKAGKHTLQIKIPQGGVEGNSFSFWSVSGVLIGE